MPVLFFRADQNSMTAQMDSLLEICKAQSLDIEVKEPLPDPEQINEHLPDKPCIILLPAIEEDCLGVKLTQNALAQSPPRVLNTSPRVILLFAPELPSKEFMGLAYREGVDDIIDLSAGKDALHVQITRAVNMLEQRRKSSFNGHELKAEIEKLTEKNEKLQATIARLEERLQALAGTAIRLATGELQFGQSAPTLLIVTSSQSQGTAAENLATKIGFQTRTLNTGNAALEAAKEIRPKLLLTDGTLPDMDASELAHKVRKSLGKHPMVIIAWSSNAELKDKLLSPSGGLDDFIVKRPGDQGNARLAEALLGGLR